MKNTFNVKIVIFLILLIISLLAVSSVFIFDLAPFEGKDYVFIPLIIAMIFTLIRFYNNLIEKSKIVEAMKKQKEASLNQATIQFNTCPEYWTKTTKNETVLCRNMFTDRDGETMVIGGKLVAVADAQSNLDTIDSASNIGFAQFSNSTTDTSGSSSVTKYSFDNLDYTYIPSMRSNIQMPASVVPVVEQFSQTVPPEDTVPHMHKRTEILYTPTNSDVKWADGADRAHGEDKLKDSKHFEMYEYSYVHDHTSGDYYDLDFKKYNPESGSFDALKSAVTGEDLQGNTSRSMYSNDTNWISPYEYEGELYAEINLNELNKASNKCELVKNLPWVEAKAKCETVNVNFEA